MIPSSIPFLFRFFVPIFLSIASAQIYDISIPPQDDDSYEYADFRIYINDSLETIRGVYFFMHPWHGDSRNIVNDEMLKALCDSSQFALMGAHFDNMHMETGVGDAVIDAMNGFVEMTGKTELAYTPFFINGYSWGGQFGYHFTVWDPDRVIGFITQKGGYHDTTDAGDAISVPGLMFIGEDDLDYRITNLTGVFLNHRPIGAQWSLAVEQGSGHSQVQDWDLLNAFFYHTVQLRLPDSTESNHPVELLPIDNQDAWYGDQSSWVIGSYECYDGVVDSSSWFPSQKVGELWQNFASEGTVEDTSECDGPQNVSIRIPAEWESQKAIWLQWPLQFEHWMRPEMANVIATVQTFEDVHLIVQNESHLADAQSQVQEQGGNPFNLNYHIWEHNNAWLRDNGPLYVKQENELTIHNMQFDSWGGLVPNYQEDNAIPCTIAYELGLDCNTLDFIMERGNLEFNGCGALITNWDCWADRNPNLVQNELDLYLKQIWGLDQIVWTYGHSEWDVTTGHIDGVARFVNDSTVLVGNVINANDPDAWICDSAAVVIENAGFNVVRMDMPGYIDYYNWTIPALYLNYIIVDGAIIGNAYNVPEWDNEAQSLLEVLFPRYEVILLYTPEVNLSGGGIHCITNDQPEIIDILSMKNDNLLPSQFQLHNPYPNPFNPTTIIPFSVETQSIASLQLYEITGRLVEILFDGILDPGNHKIKWDASAQSSGIYFVVLKTPNKTLLKKLVLLK